MIERFVVRHESGADWAIDDSRTKRSVATGLSLEEAEESAKKRNEGESEDLQNFA